MIRHYLSVFLILLLLSISSVFGQRQMEKLNRGLVAVRTSASQVFLSWRLLGNDPDNIAFNIYRGDVKINASPVTTATNYTDATTATAVYTVKPVINGVETGESHQAAIWATNYLDLPLSVPAAMTMPDATTCTYSPNDCSVGDADGDGEYEIFVKWDPSNSKDNSQSGYTGNVFIDCYKLNGTRLWRIDLGKNVRAGAHYVDIEVEDFDGDGKAEIACRTAPNSKDGLGNFLSKGPAATDNDATDYRNTSGYILTGPEYLTVFSGLTGAELATANYVPARGTVSSWGDNYGNRVDRFLACTAYLDGLHPSIVMCRGYYTRAVLAAWDYRNGVLTQRWIYDSNTPNGANAAGQGNHNLSVGDVDNDGKDEIVYGASAFDDNGKCLYSTGLGHGDAMHLTDLDPDRKGLELWEVHESTGAAYGYEMHDPKTGAILWGKFTGSDNGRGLAANIDASNRGFEMWSASGAGIYNTKGVQVSTNRPSMNFRIYWDGDLQDELLDGTSITKWNAGTLLTASGCSSNNSTKATPNLSADILGDWREELILRTSDNTRLRIFTTTIPTTHKLYTLMHDTHYRNSIAWQNTGYNQPPHAGFYIGDDMDTPPASALYDGEKRWKNGSAWDNGVSASWTDSLGQISAFSNGDQVLFDISAAAHAAVSVSGDLTPRRMKVNSPYNVTVSGNGSLTGAMDLKKLGAGTLTLNNHNSFTGTTTVWDGDFYNNGTLSNSVVSTKAFVKLAGTGVFGNHVNLGNNSSLNPGKVAGEAAAMTFVKALKEEGAVSYTFDVVMNSGSVVANDTLVVGGDWTISGKSTFTINVVNGVLPFGDYTLMRCAGAVPADLTKIKVVGVPASRSFILRNNNGNIVLHVKQPSGLIWKGNVDSKWDQGKTANWLEDANAQVFLSNDSVLFDDSATLKSVVISEAVMPGAVTVDASSFNFTFSGTGSIEGTGGLIKNGAGKLTLSSTNRYTGKTIINGGTVEMGSLTNGGIASPLGAASNLPVNLQLNGGKLSYYGPTVSTDRGITLGTNDGSFSVLLPSTVVTTTGKFTGDGQLIKEGAGRLLLSAVSDHKGGTLIKAGTLMVNNTTGSGLGTGAVEVNTGGTLAGTGIIAGAVAVNANGILSPGNGAGTLTISNNVDLLSGGILAIDIDKSIPKNDLLSLTGTLNIAGKLQITALNGTTFASGDEFKIFNGTVTGAFSGVLPATPGDGLAWDLTRLSTQGTIRVTIASGIDQPQMNLRVYPNPFTRQLIVEPDSEKADLMISIESLQGQKVYTNRYANLSRVQLELDHLPQGAYILRIVGDNQQVIKKIIKE